MAFELKDLDAIPPEAIPAAILRLSARLIAQPPSLTPPSPTPASPLLTAKEMALRLGVHESKVRTMAREHTIPSRQIGRYTRFDPDEVMAPLAHQTT